MSFEEITDGPEIAHDAGLPAGETPVAAPLASVMPTAPAANMDNIPGVRPAQINDLSLSPLALATKKQLDAEPRVPLIIPLDPGEKPGAYRAVSINTYRFEIKKNSLVYVPQSVAFLVMNAIGTTIEALENHPRNINNQSEDVKKALGIA